MSELVEKSVVARIEEVRNATARTPLGLDPTTAERLPPEFPLRVPEMAERLRVSKATAWRLIADGQIRAVRIRGATRVLQRDLSAFLAG